LANAWRLLILRQRKHRDDFMLARSRVESGPFTRAYLLTLEAAVLAAQSASDVTVTRVPAMDFLCPIQF